jgi:hypothetical protein
MAKAYSLSIISQTVTGAMANGPIRTSQKIINMNWVNKVQDKHVSLVQQFRPALHVGYTNEQQYKADFQLALPHYVYTVGLDSLIKGDALDKDITSIRVVEICADGDAFHAIYDIDTADTVDHVKEAHHHKEYLEKYFNVIYAIVARYAVQIPGSDIRLLNIPGIYLEALWVHCTDTTEDIFVPVRSNGAIALFVRYGYDEFIKLITAQAHLYKDAHKRMM